MTPSSFCQTKAESVHILKTLHNTREKFSITLAINQWDCLEETLAHFRLFKICQNLEEGAFDFDLRLIKTL